MRGMDRAARKREFWHRQRALKRAAVKLVFPVHATRDLREEHVDLYVSTYWVVNDTMSITPQWSVEEIERLVQAADALLAALPDEEPYRSTRTEVGEMRWLLREAILLRCG